MSGHLAVIIITRQTYMFEPGSSELVNNAIIKYNLFGLNWKETIDNMETIDK